MVVEIPRTAGVADPITVPGNPVNLADVVESPNHGCLGSASTRDRCLHDVLGLGNAELEPLVAPGVITLRTRRDVVLPANVVLPIAFGDPNSRREEGGS